MDTYSEEWRAICECRHVANLPDREARRRYLDGVKRVRGVAAALRLEEGVRTMWRKRRGAIDLAGDGRD